MIKVWQRIIAIAEVIGGVLALSATIFAAQAGVTNSTLVLGVTLDLLVFVAGMALWFKPKTGIVLSEIALAVQSIQVFSGWLVWQYVAGTALLIQHIDGKIEWSGGLLVRHTFFQDEGSNSAGLGINLIAIAAVTFLIMTHRRETSEPPQGTA